MSDPFSAECARLRGEVETLRRWGDSRRADAAERVLDALEDAHRQWWEDELPTSEAASWSGYSAATLADYARRSEIAAVKRGGEWTFRRCDLPRKVPEGTTLAAL